MKIRTDFVTNSSSSSFIACGVFSEELADFVVELLGGKTQTYARYQVGALEVSDNIVSVTTTLDYGNFYIFGKMEDDWDQRTRKQQEADDLEANTPENIANAFSPFLPRLTQEQREKLENLLEAAIALGDTHASVYVDQTDGFEVRQFLAHDFSSGKTKGKILPRKAGANEAKKAGANIQIITKAHLEACVAANAFVERIVLPTRAEIRAAEAQRRREEKAEKDAKIRIKLQQIFDVCASTKEKYFSLYDICKEFQEIKIYMGEMLSYIEKAYGMSAERYFIEKGILESEKRAYAERIRDRYNETGPKIQRAWQKSGFCQSSY